jgi:hypothetical protein
VTLHARHRNVQPDEGQLREVMVERDAGRPGLHAVTLVAGNAELADVYVVGAMTRLALAAQLLRRDRSGVTRVAVESRVTSFECQVRIARMIERRRLPVRRRMAAIAGGTEPRRVRVVGHVTASAVPRQRVVQVF